MTCAQGVAVPSSFEKEGAHERQSVLLTVLPALVIFVTIVIIIRVQSPNSVTQGSEEGSMRVSDTRGGDESPGTCLCRVDTSHWLHPVARRYSRIQNPQEDACRNVGTRKKETQPHAPSSLLICPRARERLR